MSILDFIKSLFFKKPAPRTNSTGNVIPPPKPAEYTPPEPEVITPAAIALERPWVYPDASFIKDPDGGKEPLRTKDNKPVGVVIHHTATYSLNATIEHFKNNVVDVHFVLGHDGKVVQMVECNLNAAHAGESSWGGLKYLNNYYIGIEVVNIGWLTRKNDVFYDGYGRVWKGEVRPRKILGYDFWEPFTEAQELKLLDLCVWLCKKYGIDPENIRAHYEVSPGRKNDPAGGLHVTFDQFRKRIGELL